MYLVRNLGGKGKNKVAHHWTGDDTYCRMHSTGGLSKKKYSVTYDLSDMSICTMCQNVYLARHGIEPEQQAHMDAMQGELYA